jgi:hypothetical protein
MGPERRADPKAERKCLFASVRVPATSGIGKVVGKAKR